MKRLRLPSPKEAAILRLLAARGESYGLALVDASSGSLKRGTVYVTLDRMEDKGLIKSREENTVTDGYVGIRRRLYKTRDAGLRALHALEAGQAILSGRAS